MEQEQTRSRELQQKLAFREECFAESQDKMGGAEAKLAELQQQLAAAQAAAEKSDKRARKCASFPLTEFTMS